MEAYLWAFVNFEQNNWAKLLPIVESAYNNAKNSSTSHRPFKLKCGYHRHISFEEDTHLCCPLKSAVELSAKLGDLMTVCLENLHHA